MEDHRRCDERDTQTYKIYRVYLLQYGISRHRLNKVMLQEVQVGTSVYPVGIGRTCQNVLTSVTERFGVPLTNIILNSIPLS